MIPVYEGGGNVEQNEELMKNLRIPLTDFTDASKDLLSPSDSSIQNARSRLLSAAKTYRPSAPPNLSLTSSTAMNTSLNSIIVADIARGGDSQGGSGLMHSNALFSITSNQEQSLLGHGPNPWIPNNPTRSVDDQPQDEPSTTSSMNAATFETVDDGDSVSDADALYENNQKLELVAALIRHRDWTNAQAILDRFTGYWATAYRPLNHAICELLHYLIEPLYAKVCPLPSGMQRSRRRVFDLPVDKADSVSQRLSKENIKPMGRQLGKLSHSNPGLLFDLVGHRSEPRVPCLVIGNFDLIFHLYYLLNTVQLYTNIIGPVVEALKYVSSLGYDILTFCIIEALVSDESKLEDVQFSQGLQALSTFTGLLCKKYQFDLAGILQYVLNQLKAGKSYDLLILREILHRMSGIDVIEEMTDEQVESMSGGELLLQEGGYYAQIRNTRKNATRLKEALMEHNMIMPFIFLMARQRDAVLFLDDPERHVKLAGRLYDQCQGTLVQFITFLSLQLTREEMQTQCLPIEQMMGEFHVPADTAFCLHRSVFEQKVARLFESKENADELKVTEKSKSTTKSLFAIASQQICSEIARAIRPLYPNRVWDDLGTNFFVTFWSLQSSDLVVPEAAYQRQMQQLREQISQIDAAVNGWTSARKKREVDRLQGLIDRLGAEQTARLEHVSRVRAWLLAERDTWFQTRSVNKADTITQFLQLCIYPRVCYTTADAIYAAQFMHVLHQLKTSRFSTLICLDRIFNDITLPVSMCTEDEAHRYGRFLCAVLELVNRWHASEDVYNQECSQFPGFVTVFRKGSDANDKADQLEFENYRHVVHKWHYRITKAIVACLESGSYVQIRNALIVLTRMLPQYPRIIQFGSAVERRVLKLKDEEKDRRPDLKALALSYSGLIRFRKDKWINEEDFHVKENKPLRSEPISSVRNSAASSSHNSNVSSNPNAHPAVSSHPSRPIMSASNADGPQSSTRPSATGGHGTAMSNGTHVTTTTTSNSSGSGGPESSHGPVVSKRSVGHPTAQRTVPISNESRGRPSQPGVPAVPSEPAIKTAPAPATIQSSAPNRVQSSPNKQRAVYRAETTNQSQSNEVIATTAVTSPEDQQSMVSKRRRMDPSTAASTTTTSAPSGNAAAAKPDEVGATRKTRISNSEFLDLSGGAN
ncbi:unnamed protein product [Echinostoma caproni]|uniref:THO complex subunit 2 n=1 Tax=Echinostoma caproni TaxID=27848 RepID=A0A183ABF5_9TREM|nr:unnamed protein product [Echinostoma caproni]